MIFILINIYLLTLIYKPYILYIYKKGKEKLLTILTRTMYLLSKSEEWVYDKTCKDGRRQIKRQLQAAKSKKLEKLHRLLRKQLQALK